MKNNNSGIVRLHKSAHAAAVPGNHQETDPVLKGFIGRWMETFKAIAVR